MSETVKQSNNQFYQDIKSILQTARDNAYKSVNFIMVEAYWNVGKKIVEVEQHGETKAKYGSNLISELSKQLTADFGSGFSARNIRNMRQFYFCFPIWQTVSAKLSWSHYLLILKIENEKARDYYIQESIASNMYDDLEKNESDNPTIGIILCTDKDETIVKYSHINSKDNLFVSKYQLYLPSEEELKREIERDVLNIETKGNI